MDIENSLVLDGFHVSVTIERQYDGTFRLVFTTMPVDSLDEDARRVWAAPQASPFKSEDEASKHARYLMLGICRVSASGEPDFSVV
jgi:hypothetical protein